MLPRSSQLVAKIAEECPTCGQDRPKYSPRASSQTPQDPKMWPKRTSVVRCYTSAIFLKIAPKTNKNVQKSSPNGLKMAILAPTWPQDGHLGPNLGELGAILAPTWRHLASCGRDFGRSEPGQNWPKSAKTAFERFFVSRSPPRAPRPPPDPLQISIFQVFRSIFQRFSSIFQNTFL